MADPKKSLRAAIAAILALALSGCGDAILPLRGPRPTPGAQEARDAWKAVAGKAPAPRRSPKPPKVDLDFLKGLFEFIDKHRLAILILAAAFIAGLFAFLIVMARRRSARGLPPLLRRKPEPIEGAAEDAGAEEGVPSAELYRRALAAAAGGDESTAAVLLRRARVAELAEDGILPRHRELGDREIAAAVARAGASEGSYRLLSRTADSVLFGDRRVPASEWKGLLDAYAASKAVPE